MRFRVIIDLELTQALWGMSKASREQIIRILDTLADSPFIPGESFTKDDTQRVIHHRTFGKWRFSYWHDGPVSELRIVHIRRDS